MLPLQLLCFDFKSLSADYEVTYGIFGQVGKAHATLEIEEGTYKVRIVAEGTGFAKFISQDRKEVYESTGILKENKFHPSLFVKRITWGKKEVRKRYFFDHKKKRIFVINTRIDGNSIEESREILPYYAANDILSIFFNLKEEIGEKLVAKEKKTLYAVGANKKDGALSVQTPSGKLKDEIKKLLKKEDHLLVVILHQKLFSSKQGELFININDQGIGDSIVLKDVVMYGDLTGKIKNLKIEK